MFNIYFAKISLNIFIEAELFLKERFNNTVTVQKPALCGTNDLTTSLCFGT